MKKTITEIIEELNDYTGKTLSITFYGTGWQLSSYENGSLFSEKSVWGKDIKEILIIAYKMMLKYKKELA